MQRSFLTLLLIAICPLAAIAFDTYTLTPGSAATASNATNTTAGTAILLPRYGLRNGRIWGQCIGTAGSTNGNEIVHFAGSYDGTNYDTTTNIKITIPLTGGAVTNQFSDWFNLEGLFSVKQLKSENTSAGATSNLLLRLTVDDTNPTR